MVRPAAEDELANIPPRFWYEVTELRVDRMLTYIF